MWRPNVLVTDLQGRGHFGNQCYIIIVFGSSIYLLYIYGFHLIVIYLCYQCLFIQMSFTSIYFIIFG